MTKARPFPRYIGPRLSSPSKPNQAEQRVLIDRQLVLLCQPITTSAKMASGVRFALLLCLSVGLLAPSCCEETNSTCPGPCPPVWTQFGSRCFSFVNHEKTWLDAENSCKTSGGHLASVHSDEEHAFLKNFIFIVAGVNKRTWIGGFDAVLEGVWMWSDGSPFNYKRWILGQPDSYSGNEDCLEFNLLGLDWNDAPCTTKSSFLCSKNL